MVLQPSQPWVCSGSQSLVASSRVAQLEAGIARLNEALRQRHQIAWRLACWPSASRSVLSGRGGSLSTKTVALLAQN